MKKLLFALCFLSSSAYAGTITTAFGIGGGTVTISTAAAGQFVSNSSSTFVQKATDGGTGSSPGASFGSATTAGNLIYVALGMSDATFTKNSLTDGCGDTFTEAPNSPVTGSGNRIRVYTTVTAGGCSGVSYSASVSAVYGFIIAEYTNPTASSYVDCDNGGSGNSTALLTTACSATHAGDTLLAFGYQPVGSVTFTAGTGYTIQNQQGGTSLSDILEDQHVFTAGTYTGSATSNTSGQWTMHMLAVKANP
jgi:hypothetical protein